MKHLVTLFFTVLFLVSCSGATEVASSTDSASEETETSTEIDPANREDESEAEEAVDESEDAEGGDDEDAESDGDDEEDDTAGIDQKNVKLVVANQTTAGQVVVKQVATSRDGWLSVHRTKEDGGILLPDSIGEARVDSGDSEDIIIDLWEAPDIDEKLWVLLHIDAGERGKYEFPGKDAAVKKNDETMARSFVIQDPNPDEDEDDDDE